MDVTCEYAQWPVASCGGTNWSCGGGRPSSMLPPRYNPLRETVSLRAYSPWVPDSQANRWRYIYTAERKCQVQPHPLFFHENIIVFVPGGTRCRSLWASNTDARVPPPAICDPSYCMCGHGIGTSAYPPPGHSPTVGLDVALSVSDRAFYHVPALLYVFLLPPSTSLLRILQSRALCALPSSHHYHCHCFPLAWNHVRFMG
jgi:hypothetical protein